MIEDRKRPMTPAERQWRRRKTLKDSELFPIYVRGKNGFFDERIRLAQAVKNLAENNLLPTDTLQLILDEAVACIPADNLIDKKFIKKLISEYLQPSNGKE